MKKLFLGLFAGLFIWGLFANAHRAFALPPKGKAASLKRIMVPHRAVYDLSLANKHQTLSVSAITGRLVFEFTGSPCTGYTQNMRMVTRIIDGKGQPTLLDVRSDSWEGGKHQKFRFVSRQFSNKKLQEYVVGLAKRDRKKSKLQVQIKNPDMVKLELPGDVLFPVQHSLALQRAAREGQNHLDVRVYDGSEQGQGFYKTYSFIGRKLPALKKAGAIKEKTRKAIKNKRLAVVGLSGLASWPVAVSYFDITDKNDDKTPVYELSFRMFENGVSSSMLMNYGHFAISGRLGQVKYLREKPCDQK
ncbi:MAG: cell envelope integrity EipB family protein [Hyphomicrobiaceae bacterium]|nr:cell envelope integrity EipB family protein [Hyphomicrobiaceae bacterium]